MSIGTILYVSDKTIGNDPILGALRSSGYKVVCADSSSQGIALLFLVRSVAAVVLHDQLGERSGADVAQTLRTIRPDVPVVLLCPNRIDPLPSSMDVCVSLSQPLEMVTLAIQRLLTRATAACVERKDGSSCAAA